MGDQDDQDGGRKSQTLQAVKDAAVPKEKDGSISWKKLTSLWSKATFVVTVLGTLIGGGIWVKDRLDTIENNSTDLSDLKDSNAAILATQREQDQRITDQVNRATKMIRDEFEQRDQVDRELRANIRAVLVELRARHGIITTADDRVFPEAEAEAASASRVRGGAAVSRRRRVQEAQEASDRATIRSGNALPQGDPLAGLDGL